MDRPKRMVLSVTEAAELLGISRSLAYDLVARGELPARRFGGRIVVLLRPLQRLLDDERADDAYPTHQRAWTGSQGHRATRRERHDGGHDRPPARPGCRRDGVGR